MDTSREAPVYRPVHERRKPRGSRQRRFHGAFGGVRCDQAPASAVQEEVSFWSSRAEPSATSLRPVAVWMARMVVV